MNLCLFSNLYLLFTLILLLLILLYWKLLLLFWLSFKIENNSLKDYSFLLIILILLLFLIQFQLNYKLKIKWTRFKITSLSQTGCINFIFSLIIINIFNLLEIILLTLSWFFFLLNIQLIHYILNFNLTIEFPLILELILLKYIFILLWFNIFN